MHFFSLVMSRYTVNDVLESIWDVSGNKEDISDSEDSEGDNDYMSENEDFLDLQTGENDSQRKG